MALVYIDDRGFRFDGDWDAAFQAIQMEPWWRDSTRAPGTVPKTRKPRA